MIKHIWFDFSGTLNLSTAETSPFHNQLVYKSFAEAIGKPLNEEVAAEFDRLLGKHKSNSAVFRSLGLPGEYWANCLQKVDPSLLAMPAPNALETLKVLKDRLPISLFTNIEPSKILKFINIPEEWFTYEIKAGMIKEPKPNIEGFNKILEMTKLPSEEILYVGDSVQKDILPAKSLGIKTCLVWNTSLEADWSCEKFEEILGIVK